ncbi:NAD/NADP transhydrogenase alpha subunit [Aequorivita sublithincola DSM 14238]|uniref:proton-translocating NAD(P)(+) transhydrogenase n=1 Tax=Aequorivita sublithincola (strain DSM 14238 / LMG 21431 / ACAM 643 / 9-3) TaxID=746697 RepID=I3YVE0_AEQSU|nr:NAD(P) transhydrogenase subunit alpha [Aequorivita sublithincola]AFL80958.1 NAD/NADP transhydrogenase alpha subunit [Aequorivita sublithincola DSM 14238]
MSEQLQPKTIGILKTPNDPRVCLLPKEVKRLAGELNLNILFEPGLGSTLQIEDEEYIQAGATSQSREFIFKNSDTIVSINHTFSDEDEIKQGCCFIGIFNPLFHDTKLAIYKKHGATVYSLDLLPRTTLAQSMDVLSSMASLAGYRAVIKASEIYDGVFPMFTTAAGTLTPVKVLVLGAGVAGLQAIATARRLGAMVEAFDVRKSAGEEVRSLGATFIEVEGYTESANAGGYAVEQSEEYQKKQKELIHNHIQSSNIVISTANIPGRKAPLLIETRSVEAMQPGSVIIDLAAEQGGNCELSKNKEVVLHHGVTILGNSSLSAEIPAAASKLLSNNFFSFLKYKQKAETQTNDPLLTGSQILNEGEWTHPHFNKNLQPA